MAAGAVAYMGLMLWQGWRFIASGRPAVAVLGLAVMVLPLIGLWLVWKEIQFAGHVQQLADRLAAAGQLPPELPRTPSGRVQLVAAADEFAETLAQVKDAPRDPAVWFRMSLAYDAGRDRPRARAAMRYAVALDRGEAPAEPPDRLLPPA
jgi:hypothetical protein